ncbi:hypothetical protein [Chondromyces apiculatus]|uniref:hypothetical protein n=1 Tax=Chondromyces apiculatus TaxID=51 RepID=UPI0012DE6ADD|nr:hypothetical protein [Chondromyces apiculatus]
MSARTQGDLRDHVQLLEAECQAVGLISSEIPQGLPLLRPSRTEYSGTGGSVLPKSAAGFLLTTCDAVLLIVLAGLLAARALRRRAPGFVPPFLVSRAVLAVADAATGFLTRHETRPLRGAQDWREGDACRLLQDWEREADEAARRAIVIERDEGADALPHASCLDAIAHAVSASWRWVLSVGAPPHDAVWDHQAAVMRGKAAVQRSVEALTRLYGIMEGHEPERAREAQREAVRIIHAVLPPPVLLAELREAWRDHVVDGQIAEQRAALGGAAEPPEVPDLLAPAPSRQGGDR